MTVLSKPCYGIAHVLAVVEPGQHPAIVGPGEGHLLIPGEVELPCAVVVVAQDGEPDFAIQSARVDPIEGLGRRNRF